MWWRQELREQDWCHRWKGRTFWVGQGFRTQAEQGAQGQRPWIHYCARACQLQVSNLFNECKPLFITLFKAETFAQLPFRLDHENRLVIKDLSVLLVCCLHDYLNICSEFNTHIFKISFVSIKIEGCCESCNKRELMPLSTRFNVVLVTVREITLKDTWKSTNEKYQ